MVKTNKGVVIWPDPVLDSPTQPVVHFGDELSPLLADMERIMLEAEGIGIAANQIGVGLAIALVCREDGTIFEIVNPAVVEQHEPFQIEEGCLSVPGERDMTPRFKRVKVKYQDKHGAFHELDADGRLAHVLQHEIDHLYGMVFVKRLSQLRKTLIRKYMVKYQRQLSDARERRKDE